MRRRVKKVRGGRIAPVIITGNSDRKDVLETSMEKNEAKLGTKNQKGNRLDPGRTGAEKLKIGQEGGTG